MLISCIPVLLLLIPGRCSGWGLFSIRLVNYKNPGNTLFNGECCDTLTWCSSNQCENYFKFCVSSLGSLQPCNLGSSQTKVLGDDNFQFPGVGGSLGTDLLNPLTYNFSSWQGGTVVVEVWDDDGGQIVGALHDFVDKYTLTIARDADPDPKSAMQETKKLCGTRSCMTVTVTLQCGPDYLVPDCHTHCVSRNDSLGHYRCNFTAGRKVCHDGWYDPFTDCVKKKKVCIPRNDSFGHYNCDPVSGEILCLDGWTGNNCTRACPSSSCDLITAEATTKCITESSALNLITLATSSPLYTTTHVNVAKSTTDRKNLLSSYFIDRQSSVFHYTTFYSGSLLSWNLGTSVTQHSSLLYSQSGSVKLSMITVASSYQILTPETLSSKFSSSLSYSSSSLSLMSTLSPSSSLMLFETSSHGSLSFLTPSPTRYVIKSSSMAPSPSTVRPTDGIEIEIKPHHNWTTAKDKEVRLELVNKVNAYCTKQHLSCQITPNNTVNRTIFNMSHVIIRVTNGSNGKVFVRVKVKLPDNVPHIPGSGYLPSIVLKRVVLENKPPMEKSLGVQIVTVREVMWDHPTLPPVKSSPVSLSIRVTATVIPTILQNQDYTGFLPYVLVALCLTAAVIVGFAFYRRSKLREVRVRPEPESPSEEELLVLPSRKPTLVRPCSAPNDTTRKENYHSDLKSSNEDPEDYDRGNNYLFRSEPRLRELTVLDLKSPDEDTDDNFHANKNIFCLQPVSEN